MPFTKQDLLSVCPRGDIRLIDEISKNIMTLGPQYGGLDTLDEILQFLAQAIHESNGLSAFKENLYYSSAERIAAVWPSRFSKASAVPYARNPEKLANSVYANRMGNGPESSGDGWKYCGRGMLQATGKSMYSNISNIIGYDLVSNPEAILLPKYNLLASLAVAKILKLGQIHDFHNDTKVLNGGYTNYGHRLEVYEKLKKLAAT